MTKTNNTALIVAVMRDGKMKAVRNYGAREVHDALWYIQHTLDAGNTVNVTIVERCDGEQLSELDRKQFALFVNS